MSTTATTKQKRSNFSLLKVGSRLSEIQFYTVKEIDSRGIKVVNERGFEFSIGKDIVEEGLFSADQFIETVTLNQGQLIEKFSQCWNAIFTVNFMKKPNEKTVAEKMKSISFADFNDQKKMKKLAEEITLGEERTLTGYLIKTENGFSRSEVIDLGIERDWSKDYDNRIRQVDHRTINWFIYKNVKYISK